MTYAAKASGEHAPKGSPNVPRVHGKSHYTGRRFFSESVAIVWVTAVLDQLELDPPASVAAAIQAMRTLLVEYDAEMRAGFHARMKELLAASAPRRCPDLYFALNPSTGLVKIGVSSDVGRRVRELGAAAGASLEVLGIGEGLGDHEGSVHRRFADRRRGGEWFEDCPEIRALAANPNEHVNGPAAPKEQTNGKQGSAGSPRPAREGL